MIMTPFKAAQTFLALKLHFTSDSYDVIKYRGRVNMTKESFEKRKDRYRLEKLANKLSDEEVVHFFVANFVTKASYSGLWDDQSEARYTEWKKYRHALKYNFTNEINRMFQYAVDNEIAFDDIFVNPDGHPLVLLAYMGKEISLDTFVILDRLYKFVDTLDNNVVTSDLVRLSRKYNAFVQVDLETYGTITTAARQRIFG